MKADANQEPLAMELLKEIKASARRWFVCFCIMVALELVTIFGFIWYISLPVEEVTTEEIQQENNGDESQLIGGDYYGKAEDNQDSYN